MENPERRFIYSDTEQERAFERTYLNLNEAHQRAAEVLNEYRIEPRNLNNRYYRMYDPEEMKRDTAEVNRLKREFGEEPSKNYSEVLEAIICEHGELSNWFGENSRVIKTSDFDDIKNGVDMVVEFDQGEEGFENLALAVDVTFGKTGISKKLEGIKSSIDNERLTKVKYFKSERQPATGKQLKIPKIVIGIDKEHLTEVGLLWMNRRNKDLASHPIQAVILQEAREQLEMFRRYAESQGKTEIAKLYAKDLSIIEKIIDEKKDISVGTLSNDKVFGGISERLREIFSKAQ